MASTTEKRTVEIIMDGKQPSGTLKALNADIRTLNKSIRELPSGSKEFDVQAQKLRELKKEYAGVQTKVDGTSKSLAFFKQQLAAVAVGTLASNLIIGTFTAIQSYISNSITYMADLSDELANIRKTTGLSAQGVDELNRSLSQIDTRTTNKALREIAIGLGQIGESANIDNIRAIDTVVVALGDEFGGSAQEITTAISILRNNLTDFKTGNYADDILKIGNALNVLGATGLATAPVVTDIATRISGVLQGFGVSTAQTLGLAAAMQELGIGVERGSTAVTKLVQKMSQNPEVFAKVAGAKTKKEIQEFIELLNKDAVAALLKVAKGAKNAGNSNVEFAAILKELETTGAGVGEVLSKFAANTDLVTKRINNTSEALTNTNSINQEFALLNENTAAKLEKLKKAFTSISETKSYNEFLFNAINGTIFFIKWIKEAGHWINTNIYIFKAIGAAIITYIAALRLATIWQARKILLDKAEAIAVNACVFAARAAILAQEILTGRIALSTVAQRIFNTVVKANPYVLLASVIAGATVALNGWITAQKEAAKQKLSESFDKEIKKIKKSGEQVLSELAKSFPDPSKLTKEQIEENTKAIQKKLVEQRAIVLKEAAEGKKLLAELQKASVTTTVSAGNPNSPTDKVTFSNKKNELEKIADKKSLEAQNERTKNANAAYKKLLEINAIYLAKKKEENDLEVEQDDAAKKKQLEQQKKFNDELAKLLNDVERAKIEAIEEEDARELLFLQKDKEDKEAQINQEIDAQQLLAKELGKGTAVLKKLEEDRGFLLLGVREKYERDRKALIEKQAKEKDETAYKKEIEAITQKFETEKLVEKQLYAEGLSTKEKFEHQIQDIDRQSKVELLAIAKKYGKSENELMQSIADIDIKIAEDRTERMKRALLNEAEVRVRLANLDVNGNKTNKFAALQEQYDAETNLLVTKLATEAGVTELSEENIFNIKKQYADQFAQLDQQYTQERQNSILSLVDTSINAFSGLFDAILDGTRQNIQVQLDMLQQQTTAELAMLEDKKNKRLIYEDEYAMKKDQINQKAAKKERELKRKAAIQDKVAAIFQIGIDTAQAIMQTYATYGWSPIGIAFAALAGITGAIQLGVAASKPIPYASGGKFLGDVLDGPSHAEGGMPVVNPQTGNVVAELEGGEPVLSKKTYANNKSLVDALLWSSQFNEGRKIKLPAYFNSTPTYAYGGIMRAYQTTSLARGGFISGDSSSDKRAKRDGRNPSTGARTLENILASNIDVMERLHRRLDEPILGVWDYEAEQRKTEAIAKAKKTGSVG